MKKRSIEKVILIIFLGMSLSIVGISQKTEDPGVLLRSAIEKEEVDGELQKAIDLYQKIIEKFSGNKAIAAQAQLRIGICFEKLGQKSANLAQDAFQKVLDNYPSQSDAVRIARERLSRLILIAEKVSKTPPEPKFTKINIPTELGWSVKLSPNGKELALVSDKKLWKMPLSGNLGQDISGTPVQINTEGVEVEWSALSWSQDGKWIAFNDNPKLDDKGNVIENQSIYVVSSDGGKPKKVIENFRDMRTINYRISLSTNGNNLAFSSVEKNKQHIFSTSVDNVVPRQIVEMEAREPVFSPDGKYIAFVKDKNKGIGEGDLGLWVVSAKGGIPYKLADAGKASSPVWSADGKMIAFLDYSQGKLIHIIPVSGNGKPTGKVISIDAPEGTQEVRLLAGWTPDNKIGALLVSKQEFGLYTLPSGGGQAAKILHDCYALQPRWSRDGSHIYYVATPEEGERRSYRKFLASVSANGGKGTPLQTNIEGNSVKQFGFQSGNRVSPDGKWIVTSTWTPEDTNTINVHWPTSKIWKVSVDGEDAIQITNTPGNFTDKSPCWSADGKKIAFIQTELIKGKMDFFGDSRVYIIDSNGGEPELLDPNPCDFANNLIWSPDGKMIAYLTTEKEKPQAAVIKIIEVGSRNIKTIGDIPNISINTELVWSPDSKRIAFDDADGKVIKIMNLDDGSIEDIETGLVDVSIFHLDWSPDGKRFVFAGWKGGKAEFWFMENFLPLEKLSQKSEKEDKKFNIRRVSPDTKLDFLGDNGFEGETSPDGKYLSYTDWKTGNLAIYEITTREKYILTNEGSMNFVSPKFANKSRWSPDSKQIVYGWFNKGIIELRIIGLDGSKPRVLYRNKEVVWAQTCDWSADGTKILAGFWRKDGPIQIVLVSTEDGSVRILKTLEKKLPRNFGFSMKLSPDGRYIVYDLPKKSYTYTFAERDIFLLSTNGEPEITLCENPADDYILGWAPDGKNILFASDRRGSLDLWHIQISDGKPQGNPELVKSDIGQRFQSLGFTQEGSFYYGNEGGQDNDIYTARLDPETGRMIAPPKSPITRFKGNNWLPDYSPDGKYLAYVTGKRNLSHNLLIIHNLETGEERELLTNIHKIQKHIWSPDCKSILFRGTDENYSAGIYHIDIQTGTVTTLVPKYSDSRSLQVMQWSDDGKSFYMIRGFKSTKTLQIVIREIESGTEKELYRASYPKNSNHILYSPDGKWLSSIIREGKELKIMPAAGGESRVLYKCEQEGENVNGFRWSPDGEYIFYVLDQPKQNQFSIWRIPIEGGETQKVLEMNKLFHENIKKLSVHPDGQHVAFQSTSPFGGTEVWVMENFLPKTKDKK